MRGLSNAISIFLIGLGVTFHGPALADTRTDPWATAYDSAAGTRFIPVELWTGGQWDGNRDLDATKVKIASGSRRSISGPMEWTQPGSGEKLLVFERVNRDKSQLFVISSAKDGIGRVEDSRYGRNCLDEVKFPLGLWRQGERRVFHIACNDNALRRRITVTIERLDFTHRGMPHSLQFHWLVNDGRQRGTDMHYIYSPGEGLVEVWSND